MPEIDNERLALDEISRRRDRDRGSKDAGRTSGGGRLGHDQPADVRQDTPARNATGSDESAVSDSPSEDRRAPAAPARNATGGKADPVMPSDDATLKTKI